MNLRQKTENKRSVFPMVLSEYEDTNESVNVPVLMEFGNDYLLLRESKEKPEMRIHQLFLIGLEVGFDKAGFYFQIKCKNFHCLILRTSSPTIQEDLSSLTRNIQMYPAEIYPIPEEAYRVCELDKDKYWKIFHYYGVRFTVPLFPASWIKKWTESRVSSRIISLSWTNSKYFILRCARPTCFKTDSISSDSDHKKLIKDIEMTEVYLQYMQNLVQPKSLDKFFVVDSGSSVEYNEIYNAHSTYYFANHSFLFLKKDFEDLYEVVCSNKAIDLRTLETFPWASISTSYWATVRILYKQLQKDGVVVIQGSSTIDTDTDSILVCLLRLLVDPSARTMKGFLRMAKEDMILTGCALGSKPWITMFFLVHCVFELLHNQPEAFEYNRLFLLHFLDVIYTSGISQVSYPGEISFYKLMSQHESKPKWKNPYFKQNESLNCSKMFDERPKVLFYEYIMAFNPTVKKGLEKFQTKLEVGSTATSRFYSNPQFWLGDISSLTNITHLSLFNGVLASVSDQLDILAPTLAKLVLEDNLLTKLPPSISKFTSLELLYISRNRFFELPDLSNLTKLTDLKFDSNQIQNLAPLGNCTSLTMISALENKISQLPPQFANLGNLKELYLRHNKLIHLPPAVLKNLTSLAALDLSINTIEYIVGRFVMPELKHLNLNGLSLRVLPASIFKCINLETLIISRNKLTDLHPDIGALINLKHLQMDINEVTSLPPSFRKLRFLKNMNADRNQLCEIPLWIYSLSELESLSLANNKLTSITSGVGCLANLRVLNLEKNLIKSIPLTLSGLPVIETLNLNENEISDIPPNVISAGPKAIKAALLEKLNESYSINRTRIMVIGQENVGKTTLIKALKKKLIQSDDTTVSNDSKKNISTDGIEIQTAYVIEKKKYKKPIKQILDIWDFAGQHVYYATHQFFLTSYAIYILVFDITDKDAESRIEFWLKSLKYRMGNPTVLLVATHSDIATQSQLERPQKLKESYSHHPEYKTINFLNSFAVSASTYDNIDNLRSYLISTISEKSLNLSVSYMFFEILIKEFRDGKGLNGIPIITKSELLRIGSVCNLSRKETLKCTRYYHNIGIIQYFGKVKELKNFVVLDPRWLFDVFATLFTTKHKWVKQGILKTSDLTHIWKNYPAEIHPNLISLLERFEIAVPIREKKIIEKILGEESGPMRPSETELPAQNIAGLFLPALSFGIKKPVGSIEPLFKGKSEAYFSRHFKFSFMPYGLFSRVLAKIFRSNAIISQIWESGILYERHFNNDIVVVIVEHQSPDDIDPLKMLENTTIQIEVQGKVVENGIEEFCWILDKITFLSTQWEFMNLTQEGCLKDIVYHSFITGTISPKMFPIKPIIDGVLNGKTTFPGINSQIHVKHIIPDYYIPEYTGDRVEYKEIAIEEEIAEGGFGRVYRARCNGNVVAVKELKFDMKGETASNYQRLVFREEIVVQSKLKHNNILPITAICIPNMCMITPFCKEGNLYNVIHNSETSMSWKLRLKILVELASAIRYLHETPPTLIHRDIKSPNVLVYSLDANSSVCVYLCDFGSAIYSHRNCNERPLIDNPTWLAPEILKSTSQSYGFPVDIYSFGMIAWELVSRSKIFDGTPFFSEIEERIREGERPHIPYFIPEEYKAIITKCWAQDANQRPNWKWVQEMLDTMKANCEEYESEFGERKVLSQPRILQRKKIFKNNQPLSKAEESQKNSDRPSQKPKSSKEVFSLVANLVLPGNSSTPTATTPKKNQSKSVKMGKKLARKKGSHEEAEVVEVPVGDAVLSPTDEENCERLRSLTDNGERIVANTITASANPPVLKSNSENPNKAHALPSLNKEKYQKDRLLSLHRGQSARTHQINDDERNF